MAITRPCCRSATFNGEVHGLPFSVSLPVGYYNMDLMAKAGITSKAAQPPGKRWSRSAASSAKAGVKNPIFWGWNITGNWFLQALMWSQDAGHRGGRPSATSTAPRRLTALETMKKIFRGCDMKNLEWKGALASFSAGEIGMMFWSTSAWAPSSGPRATSR